MTLEENVQAFGLTYFGMNDKRQGSDHSGPHASPRLTSPHPVHIMAGAGGSARVSIMHMIALINGPFVTVLGTVGLKSYEKGMPHFIGPLIWGNQGHYRRRHESACEQSVLEASAASHSNVVRCVGWRTRALCFATWRRDRACDWARARLHSSGHDGRVRRLAHCDARRVW
jgi:hypothetical protein